MGHQRKEEGNIPFGVEDLLYYVKKVEEQQFDLDFATVKQYFPVKLVLSGIFKIFQDLFGNFVMVYFGTIYFVAHILLLPVI